MWDDSTKPETLLSSQLFKDVIQKEHVSMRKTIDAEHKLTTKGLKIFSMPLSKSKQGSVYKVPIIGCQQVKILYLKGG